jgi:polyphosphate kinase 2 (PPK2 family)
MALFEGRDAAGKGGSIAATSAHMNPRLARVVALTKPTDRENGQWYFQRYVSQFPTAGEFVLFDRSWYNRAGVEPVMGFCTPKQYEQFLKQAPQMEKLVVQDGIYFFKFYLDIGREMQLKRFTTGATIPAPSGSSLPWTSPRCRSGRITAKSATACWRIRIPITHPGRSSAPMTSGARA